ncbi:MAG TPA: hypothetical protein VJ689_09750 [Gaiellaceae bacterium]|jgi:hypothetical protein|nr:hypothetical protein [Gaiellaceae bacterium]
MVPRAEIAHWAFGGLFLLLGLILLAEVIVGPEVFRRRRWRAYLWPLTILVAGVLLWLVAIFSTFSTLHLIAHSLWAQAAMIAGAVQLAIVRGKLSSPAWSLVTSAAMVLSGISLIVHEQNGWLFARSAFLHHALGWTMIVAALFPLGEALRPRRPVWGVGFAMTFVVVAVMLFCDRDLAPIFGHLSEYAGNRP